MQKKYELIQEDTVISPTGKLLYRIRALVANAALDLCLAIVTTGAAIQALKDSPKLYTEKYDEI